MALETIVGIAIALIAVLVIVNHLKGRKSNQPVPSQPLDGTVEDAPVDRETRSRDIDTTP